MRTFVKRFIVSLIISLICGLLASIPMIHSDKGSELNFMTILLIILVSFVAFLCCLAFCLEVMITQDQLKEEKEEFSKNWYEAREKVIRDYLLSSDAYTQVYYLNNFTETSENFEILKIIAQNPECKFYAKLIEEEKSELIIKDKNEQIVYKKIISNFIYFEKYFAP